MTATASKMTWALAGSDDAVPATYFDGEGWVPLVMILKHPGVDSVCSLKGNSATSGAAADRAAVFIAQVRNKRAKTGALPEASVTTAAAAEKTCDS